MKAAALVAAIAAAALLVVEVSLRLLGYSSRQW